MQAALFLGRVNFEMRLQRKQQLGAGMCFNSYITYFDTGVLITCSPFPTSQRTRLWFSSHFFLCVISDFFPCHFLALHHLLPRFPIQRLKFGSCTQHLRLFQLHPIFFFFCLQTVIKPEGGQSVSWAIHSSSYRQPQGRGSSCGTQGGAPGRSNLEEDFGEQAAGLAGWGLATSGQEQMMHEK